MKLFRWCRQHARIQANFKQFRVEHMTSFKILYKKWTWREIRNCPGRYVLFGPGGHAPPEEIVECAGSFQEYNIETAEDIVVVWKFVGGGLISYRKKDGSFVHTLNTEEGFKRKLKDLGILESGAI